MTFENIVAKGEIAPMDQFLLLSQCFQLYLEASYWIVPVNGVLYNLENVSSSKILPRGNGLTSLGADIPGKRFKHIFTTLVQNYSNSFTIILTHYRLQASLQQTTFKNLAGNREIAPSEQFLHLPQCFQMSSAVADVKTCHYNEAMG